MKRETLLALAVAVAALAVSWVLFAAASNAVDQAVRACEDASSRIDALAADAEELGLQLDRLKGGVEGCKENVDALQAQLADLEGSLEECRAIIDYLQAQLAALEESNANLSARAEAIAEECASIADALNETRRLLREASLQFFTVDNETAAYIRGMIADAVDALAAAAGGYIDPWAPVEDRLLGLAEFVSLTVAYSPDPTVAYVDASGRLRSSSDILRHSAEVYGEGYGDEEDLALYALAAFKQYASGYEVAVAFALGDRGVIGAALIVYTESVAYYYDPSNSLLSGARLYALLNGTRVDPILIPREVVGELNITVGVEGTVNSYPGLEEALSAWLEAAGLQPAKVAVYREGLMVVMEP